MMQRLIGNLTAGSTYLHGVTVGDRMTDLMMKRPLTWFATYVVSLEFAWKYVTIQGSWTIDDEGIAILLLS